LLDLKTTVEFVRLQQATCLAAQRDFLNSKYMNTGRRRRKGYAEGIPKNTKKQIQK
jgi:hypothetical protein